MARQLFNWICFHSDAPTQKRQSPFSSKSINLVNWLFKDGCSHSSTELDGHFSQINDICSWFVGVKVPPNVLLAPAEIFRPSKYQGKKCTQPVESVKMKQRFIFIYKLN